MSENMLFPTVEVPELIQESEQYDEKYKPTGTPMDAASKEIESCYT